VIRGTDVLIPAGVPGQISYARLWANTAAPSELDERRESVRSILRGKLVLHPEHRDRSRIPRPMMVQADRAVRW